MSTALAPQGLSPQLAGLQASSLPAPVDKKALTAYLAVLEDPDALALQQRLAVAYDKACAALIGENDVQKEGDREFKKKSAWRKLGRYFSIATEVVKIEREYIGDEFLATVTVRATSPWGQVAEAVGSCGTDEEKGRRSISMADAIATAETRATNRSVSNLIAMGEVSAEEIGERGKADRQRPEMGLEEANTVEWPWKEPEKYAGKKLGDVEDGKPVISTLSLLRVQDWAQAKIEKKPSRQVARLLEAVTCVLDSREDLDEAQAAWDAEQAKKEAKEKGGSQPASAGAASDPTSAPPENASAPAPASDSSPTSPDTSSTKPATTPTETPSATPTAPAPVPATTTREPSVQELTTQLFKALGSDAYARNVRDQVRTRLANVETEDLTLDVLRAALAELEAATLPF